MVGNFDDYNRKMVDRLHEKWLEPPDEYEPIQTCCMCDEEAEYKVNGDFYCKNCLLEEFRI